MAQQDAVMARIGAGVELAQRGERDAARSLLDEIWADIGAGGDPFHRCALAHWMADLQDDPHDELRWDQRALEAADEITEERAQQGGVAGSVKGFYPSLHLNIGDVYRRLGDIGRARDHLARGRACVDTLDDEGYGRMIRDGLERLAARLVEA